jgi:hypothetical protein
MTNDQLRRFVYSVLTVITVAMVMARIANVELVFEPSRYHGQNESDEPPDVAARKWPEKRPASMPTLSSNDRSRWCAVRALVDHGTWVIGHRTVNSDKTYRDDGIVFEEGWQTVDRVKKPETNDYYSSKPPLLTFLAASEYWLLKHALGWTITAHTNHVVKTILIIFNVVPLLLYLWMLRNLIERTGTTDWGRLFVFAAGCFGTFVTTFGDTLNNHLPAAVCTLATLYPILMVDNPPQLVLGRFPLPVVPACWRLALSGLCTGLMWSLELPALSLATLLAVMLFLRDWKRTLIWFLPAAVLPAILEMLLNYWATGEVITYAKFGTEWYEYDGSHWLKPRAGEIKHGIDWARQHESLGVYILNMVFGHHGLFALTPLWLLSFAGMMRGTWKQFQKNNTESFFACPTLLVSLVVIAFYLLTSNNYGGHTSGLRWLIWLTPLWLLSMMPVTDRLSGSKWGRWLGYAFLAISVFSANFAVSNPWRHPWLFRLMESWGWVRY